MLIMFLEYVFGVLGHASAAMAIRVVMSNHGLAYWKNMWLWIERTIVIELRF